MISTPVGDSTVERLRNHSEQLAAGVFGLYLLVAFPLVLFVLGDYHWFFGDEWSFLAERDGADWGDLFRSHGEHWVTLPIVVYRINYNLFGLDSYLPYQAVVVASHLACAGLLRVVMRRAGVAPWPATVVASIFVLLGPGEENIVWAFQIAFVFALMFGLIHLILADHDGPLGRRDAFGLLAGLAGLMSSGVSLVMLVVVGLSVLLRRGLRPALFHTVPLVAAYGLWFVFSEPGGIDNPQERSARVGELAEFLWSGVPATLRAVGGNLVVGAVIVVVAGTGVALAVTAGDRSRRRLAAPVALLAGAALFLAGTAYTRWFVTPRADSQSRYLWTLVAFTLPVLAVGVDAVIRRWRSVSVLALAPFAVAIGLNLDGFGDRDPWNPRYHRVEKERTTLLAHTDLADEAPPYLRPNRWYSIGWLRSVAADGDIPEPVDQSRLDEVQVLLLAAQLDQPAPGACEAVDGEYRLITESGLTVGFAFERPPSPDTGFFSRNILRVELLDDDGALIGRTAYEVNRGHVLEFALNDRIVELSAAAPEQGLRVCR